MIKYSRIPTFINWPQLCRLLNFWIYQTKLKRRITVNDADKRDRKKNTLNSYSALHTEFRSHLLQLAKAS